MAVRNRTYLNWRFFGRPRTAYQCIAAVRNSEIVGYLVFRVADRDGLRCGYLIDYLIENKSLEIFSQLLRSAEEHLIRDGAKVIACVIASPPYRSALLRRGFFPALIGARNAQFEIGVHSSDPVLRTFADLTDWFVTMGDGDLEMGL